MAKINFPPTPVVEDTFTDPNTGQLFVYNGEGWVRTKQGSGIPEPLGEGVQYARIVDTQGLPGRWEKVATDIWYLGAFANHPYFDHEGAPVVKGHVYFNTVEEINYSYTGIEWAGFADIMYVFGLQTYVYVATAGQTVFTGPDNYGNSPVDWTEGATIVAVRVEGTQHLENVGGGTVPVGTYTVDYAGHSITFDSGLTLNDEVEITTYLSMPGDDASLYAFVIDEDDMVSDSATKVPTQQSVKAYVDMKNTGFKNVLLNGDLRIDQREYDGIIDADVFVADMWQMGKNSDFYQKIERTNLKEGEGYTLSWDGDGDGVLNINALSETGPSPLFQVYSNVSSSIYVKVPENATNIQLERGAIQTNFEVRNMQQELAMCQRFAERLPGINYSGESSPPSHTEIIAQGFATSSTTATFVLPFTPKYTRTSISFNNDFVVWNGSYHKVTGFTPNTGSPNAMIITCGTSGLTTGQACFLQTDGLGGGSTGIEGHIMIEAEL